MIEEKITPEERLAALKVDRDIRMLRHSLIGAGFIVLVVFGSLLGYCSQPSQVDAEQQAKRQMELSKVEACAKAGGSWIPIVKPSGYDEMGCVMPQAMPLVEQWAKMAHGS